jgi:hypothetical protein
MKTFAIIAGAVAVLNIAHAQFQLPDARVIGSGSGQFFVSARGTLSPHSLELASGPDMLTLDPALLAVSCDRIKAELLRELNMPDQWRGKIFVMVRPARSANDPIFVVPQKLGNTWHCGVELPDAVDRNRLVEAVVRATLMEMANRNAKEQPTELPEWLPRGFSRQLMGAAEMKLILRPPRKPESGGYINLSRETADFSDSPLASAIPTHKSNPLSEASEVLRTNAPLTFDELSWPTDEQLSGNGADVFGSSAQLFVSQILRVKNGPECLRNMLAEMPGYLNWQLAFQHAFEGTFPTPLDVEKWWALELSQFNGRDLLHLLTAAESAKQLDAVFQFPIQVQIGAGAPMRTDMTLQTIIRGWSRPRQMETLKSKIWELGVLRLRIAPEFMPLVDQYRLVLQDYYKKRSVSTRILIQVGLIADKSIDETVARLDALDVQRAALRQHAQAPTISAVETVPAIIP